ncbi:50S ribosomal protein L35 [candidate division WOR-3 bacterium]|nr:50S ribosomal protein L35 [candidate division WOR-3 bacterium]
MPKLRSKGTIKKRFKITGGGRVKRFKAFHSHKLSKKTSKRKRNLRKSGILSKADEKRVKKLIRE